jgi:hypothetical protein
LRAIRPVVWRRSTTIQPIHPRLCLNRVSRSPGRRYCWLPDFLRRQFFSRDGECDGYDTARRHVIGLTIYFFALWVAASLAPFQGVRQRAQCSRGSPAAAGSPLAELCCRFATPKIAQLLSSRRSRRCRHAVSSYSIALFHSRGRNTLVTTVVRD